MIISLSSCLEVYMRSIISCAIESKPGVLIGIHNAVDGVRLLKTDYRKYKVGTWKYPYSRQVNMICQGTWIDRNRNFTKLFGKPPEFIERKQNELDHLRNLRNKIAHNYGRNHSYDSSDMPIFNLMPSERISGESLIKYMQLINETVQSFENHLYKKYIGSYEIIKHYIIHCPPRVKREAKANRARWLKEAVGRNGLKSVGIQYYSDLIEYIDSI